MSSHNDIVHPVPLQRVKASTKALIRAAGGLEACQEATGKSTSTLSRYQSINDEAFAPIDVVVTLEGITHGHAGHPPVTRLLADLAGYALFRKPQVDVHGHDLLELLAGQSRMAGGIASGICTALADGKVDAHEASPVRANIADLIQYLLTMDAALAEIEGGA